MSYCKIIIGAGFENTSDPSTTDRNLREYTFQWGDGRLVDVEVELNEGNNLSKCSFSVYDPDRSITNAFFTYIKEVEGLEPNQLRQTTNPEQVDPQSPSGENPALADAPPEVQAVLNMIAWAEGTSTISGSDNGYNVNVGGSLFSSYERHPNNRVVAANSTAAGRYQFLNTTWAGLGLPDFSPANQDRGAIALLKSRGAYDNVLAREWPAMLDKISYEWASLPAANGSYRYSGQGTKTPQQVYDFLEAQLAGRSNASELSQEAAQQSIANVSAPSSAEREATLAGQQITILLGFDDKPAAAYSFIHTGLSYDLYDKSILKFDGMAAAFVLHQSKKNSAYINLTLKELAEKIAANYGLTVDMTTEGPKYVYIDQKAETDWELLVRECDRVGLIIKNIGDNTIQIKAREEMVVEVPVWRLRLGENLTNFSVAHQANSTQGARSAEPGATNSTGVKKFNLDPDTGVLIQEADISVETLGSQSVAATTGTNLASIKPLTDGKTDMADSDRKANEQRVKGITVSFETPTTPEILTVTPDDILLTDGISEFLDRVWVIESITHSLSASSGWKTKGTAYTPLKNKYPAPAAATEQTTGTGGGESDERNPGGFIWPTKTRTITSPFGPRSRGNHRGIDIGSPVGEACFASSDGTVTVAQTGCQVGNRSCGGRYGNHIYLSHSGGFQTRYAHLSRVDVSNGQTVTQGQQIGLTGNTGDSSGPHLHFEIRSGGTAIDPLSKIN